MNWLLDIWSKVAEIVNAVGTALDDLVTRIDSVQFDSASPIYQSIGTVRYLCGDTIYILLIGVIYIGTGFMMYNLIQIVLNAISSVIPGMKGKIQFK